MLSASGLLVLNETDDVAVARQPLTPGTALQTPRGPITVLDEVAVGHKVALHDIAQHSPVAKYGYQIGTASQPIRAGQHVHVHNLGFSSHTKPAATDAGSRGWAAPELPARTTFRGAVRSDGSTATRNYIAVVSTVNCSANVCDIVANEASRRGLLADFPNVDGVIPLVHDLGCGMSVDGLEILRRTLAGFASHPNVGGVVVIGLGCELNQVEQMINQIQLRPGTPLVRMNIQTSGGTRSTVESALDAITQMLPEVNASFVREERPVSELVLGQNCGGSDGLSGLTANPALGYASDLIVAQGGRSVLAETPEVYGAESLLVQRATSEHTAQRLLDKLAWWEDYTAKLNATMDSNPSPGNKAGGITTILEKSLGAVAKSGQAPLQAVYDYAAPIDQPGLGMMDTPGYDPVSVTGLIAGGANLICFTTGRGSALGTKPAPTLKLATNDDVYARMPDDMDINCGPIFSAGVSLADKGLEIYNALLDLASGEASNSEALGYGSNEFVPWHIGVVM
ncbi:MAG: altronate dehydratase family protein [Brooklawnia sp.]|uniref:UxaA family hydrolase n=1 Tax=Brooklawnia sp. TaxID=2699740 RepID=UPI003C7122F1